ncbi:hypothetical protein C9374_011113 [Naegleria lovaniensis]|uniref:Uncharacterized protein n=1 Tax=Naegleria lovaniensis TaxID=51637 RepID=A0AA88GER0_NAELO|nr:uncharacterized protein C9374_011113 [Naegleria lovaniensis]KAG2374034.1 hypothetical protein C9374_011113 [Naegleria lovaniensis]
MTDLSFSWQAPHNQQSSPTSVLLSMSHGSVSSSSSTSIITPSTDFNYLQHSIPSNASPLLASYHSLSNIQTTALTSSFLHHQHHHGDTPPSPITNQCLTGSNHYDPILLLHFLQEAKRLDPLSLMNEAKENAKKKLVEEKEKTPNRTEISLYWITITPHCSERQRKGVCEVAELLMRYAHDNNKKWLLQTACVKSVLYGFEMDEVLHGLVWLVSEKIKSLNMNRASCSGGSSTNNSPRIAGMLTHSTDQNRVQHNMTNKAVMENRNGDSCTPRNVTKSTEQSPRNSVEPVSVIPSNIVTSMSPTENVNSNSPPGTPGTPGSIKRKTPVKVVRVLGNESSSPCSSPESAGTIASKPQIVSAGSIARKGTVATRVVKRIQKQTDSPSSTPPASPRSESSEKQ